MSDSEPVKSKKEKKAFVTRSLSDVQRIRLEKLMKNPLSFSTPASEGKPIDIPERRKEKSMPEPPDFVRNVMGSSAGAGSGEFHVYRHIRRREYARQRYIKVMAEKEEKDVAYQNKLDDNKRKADEKTAKRRAKRLKKKQKGRKPKKGNANQKSESESESEESDEESKDEDQTQVPPANSDHDQTSTSEANEKNTNPAAEPTPEPSCDVKIL